MWKYALIFLALLLPLAPECQAEGNTTPLKVMARIAGFFRTQVEYQAPALDISADDVKRGYVDTAAASRFSVMTNTRDGYVVAFRALGDMFRSVVVTGLQSPLEFVAGDTIAQRVVPQGRRTDYLLNYRFVLRSDVQPGSYQWPLEISVRSI